MFYIKVFSMTVFEPRTSCVGRVRSTNWATTTTQKIPQLFFSQTLKQLLILGCLPSHRPRFESQAPQTCFHHSWSNVCLICLVKRTKINKKEAEFGPSKTLLILPSALWSFPRVTLSAQTSALPVWPSPAWWSGFLTTWSSVGGSWSSLCTDSWWIQKWLGNCRWDQAGALWSIF